MREYQTKFSRGGKRQVNGTLPPAVELLCWPMGPRVLVLFILFSRVNLQKELGHGIVKGFDAVFLPSRSTKASARNAFRKQRSSVRTRDLTRPPFTITKTMSSLLVVSSTVVVVSRKGGRLDFRSKSKVPSSTPKLSASRSSAMEPHDHDGVISGSSVKAHPLFRALVSSAAAAALIFGSAPAYAVDTPAAAETFTKTCAGCHAAGGWDLDSGGQHVLA